ncbi:MAG TPA: DUF2298 domain-containing protein [Caldilineaceae bacterium]|nr:DUF2298 domain-containing protein [Caldilineaceae bacterium]
MTGGSIIGALLAWYTVVQLLAAVALPLMSRLCRALPDRGYAAAKIAGILWVGVTLWLGTSYGLLRNDLGGAWLAVALVAAVSVGLGRPAASEAWTELRATGKWPYLLAVETLFLVSYILWAIVRAYDPAANHTEQPMDLMFMNSIWASPTYPPHDAWLAGYPISYYYLGYWLLTTVGRLAGQAPEVAYNIGQASWFGLLLIGCFGVVANLLADDMMEKKPGIAPGQVGRPLPLAGGLLGALAVGLIGNLQVVLEWLYANGYPVAGLARWIDVHNFPERAAQTHQWFISYDWWWWRSSRVIEDLNLLGEHVEVIDEFPMFSYLLGDNHPHVLAMPVVLLVVTLAMALLFGSRIENRNEKIENSSPAPALLHFPPSTSYFLNRKRDHYPATTPYLPLPIAQLGWPGLLVYSVTAGSLLFLNTWDYPPYWLLLVACCGVAVWFAKGPEGCRVSAKAGETGHTTQPRGSWWHMPTFFGGALALMTVAVYLPYFLTAQSQASGFLPNLFNPTRLPQFLLMFGAFLPGLAALVLLAWPTEGLNWRWLGTVTAVVLGVPIGLLAASTVVATTTGWGQSWLASIALPEGADGHLQFIVERWARQFWTFALLGTGLSVAATVALQRLAAGRRPETAGAQNPAGGAIPSASTRSTAASRQPAPLFALLLAILGLALVYAPEFIFLRDNFGTRMNTVFKFYYQGWLLMALATAYSVAAAFRVGAVRFGKAARVLAAVSLALMASCLLYPIAGVYSKTGGFSAESLTLDAAAYISAEERAAAEWIRQNTTPGTVVLEGRGDSYGASYNRMSTLTGRPTLLGWEGHERQWRGRAYDEMARGRVEALNTIYRTGSAREIAALLAEWQIDYVYVGPTEVQQYSISDARLQEMAAAMDLVFERGAVRIFRRRPASG